MPESQGTSQQWVVWAATLLLGRESSPAAELSLRACRDLSSQAEHPTSHAPALRVMGKAHVRKELLQVSRGQGLPVLLSLPAQKKAWMLELAMGDGHAAASLWVSRGIHASWRVVQHHSAGGTPQNVCFPPKGQKRESAFPCWLYSGLFPACTPTSCASCTEPGHCHLVPLPQSFWVASLLHPVPTFQDPKMQHPQIIMNGTSVICCSLEVEELLGLTFCSPCCERTALVHAFALEQRLQVQPCCQGTSRGHQGIFLFLPFSSGTWVTVCLSLLR